MLVTEDQSRKKGLQVIGSLPLRLSRDSTVQVVIRTPLAWYVRVRLYALDLSPISGCGDI